MFFIFYLSLSYQQYIKHAFTSKFMCRSYGDKDFGLNIKSCPIDTASKFIFKPSFDNFIIEDANNGMVLEVNNGNKLSSWILREGDNQKFIFTLYGNNTYLMKNNGLCIEYDSLSNEYKKTKCTGIKKQLFKVLTDTSYDKMKNKLLYKGKELFDNIKGYFNYKKKDLPEDEILDTKKEDSELSSDEILKKNLNYATINNLDQLKNENDSLYNQSQAMRTSSYSRRYSYSSEY